MSTKKSDLYGEDGQIVDYSRLGGVVKVAMGTGEIPATLWADGVQARTALFFTARLPATARVLANRFWHDALAGTLAAMDVGFDFTRQNNERDFDEMVFAFYVDANMTNNEHTSAGADYRFYETSPLLIMNFIESIVTPLGDVGELEAATWPPFDQIYKGHYDLHITNSGVVGSQAGTVSFLILYVE